MAEKDYEIIESLRKFAQTEKKFRGNMMTRIKNDLEFAGGAQFTAKDKEIRGEGRAEIVFNLVRNFCLQITNAYRRNPLGITVGSRSPETAMQAVALQKAIRDWESKISALDMYVLANDRQVKAGLGYLVLGTDYASSQGWDQEVIMDSIARPDMVLFDSLHKKLDGADAREAAIVDHISQAEAREQTGAHEDYEFPVDESPYINTPWVAPEGSVEMTTYYQLTRKKSKIYMDPDGNEIKASDLRKNANTKGWRSRDTWVTTVRISKVVGCEVVSSESYGLSRIPVIPVKGELIDADGRQQWVGIVHSAKDPARLINWAASMVTEKLAIAPKTTRLVDARSVANHLREWQLSNKLNLPYLPYDSKDAKGQDLPPPVTDNPQIDLESPTKALATYQTLMQDILGMQSTGQLQEGPTNETATAILTRSKNMEVANYQYPSNFAAAIKAVGKMWLEMKSMVDGEDSGIDLSQLEVDVEAGPMEASMRNENTAMLLALGELLGPEGALVIASDIARNAEFGESAAIAKKIDDYAKSKGIGAAPDAGAQDPEAVQAIQQITQEAEATIQSLQAQLSQQSLYVQQMEAERADKSLELQVAREKMLADYKRAIDVEMIKQQGSLTETQLKIQADAEKQLAAAQAETARLMATQPKITVVQGATPVMPSINRQRNDIFGG